ncbi:hypothetical protein B7494_g1618 [Chlorociboria aeruginascens]|nr:hypothetical protein B7494_g1618 [Chlorociboria aeruginascens]
MPTSLPSTDATTPTSESNVVDFVGDVNTNNDLPTQEMLKRVDNMTLLDKDGKAVPFKALYTGPNVARRVLVVFIRHFFCGNCQEYLRTLTASISPESLLQLPIPTFIAVVGCGKPSLIPMYQEVTSCPFPIYADPTKQLYDELGMLRTLNLGPRPEYQRRGTFQGMVQSVIQGLKQLPGGKTFQGGDYQQVGGEFLFEPVDPNTPFASPAASPAVGSGNDEDKKFGANGYSEEKRVTWCHRMRNTRDHAEIPELREVLGFSNVGIPGKDIKRWSKALEERKGTGFSTVSSPGIGNIIDNGGSNRKQSAKQKVEDRLGWDPAPYPFSGPSATVVESLVRTKLPLIFVLLNLYDPIDRALVDISNRFRMNQFVMRAQTCIPVQKSECLFGYDQGVMGGLLTLGSFVRTFPEIDTVRYTTENGYSSSVVNHVSTIQGISVASYNLGCFLGSIITMFIGDLLGRRRVIFLGSSIIVVGAALQASAFSLGHLIAGRVVTGLGNGMNTSTVPTWASETSKSNKRGKMVMVEGAMITGGICFSYWVDFGFSFLEPSTISWRFPIAFQIVFALLLLAVIMELPESPRWLILRGKEDEAMSVISALADLPPEDHLVKVEFAEIKDSVLEMSQYGYKDLFTMGPDRNFHRVVLGYVNQVFQQISGINLITYYAATIYSKYIGLTGLLPNILAACNGTEYFMASWVAVYTIEKFGRRSLMLFGAVGMSGSMAILAGMDYLAQNNRGNSAPGIVQAVFLFVYNTFFAIGWLGMTVVMITPVAFSSIGFKTYVIFAVINAFIIPVVYFFYPETAYRSLEEIDTIFRKTEGWFEVVLIARNEPRRYGEDGQLLIDYEQTDEHVIRQQSIASREGKQTSRRVENVNVREGYSQTTTDEKTAII